MKRILSSLLCLILILSTMPFTTLTVNATDSTEEVIEVYTIEDLYNINNNMSGNYKLMNDIDMTEATAEGGEWNYMGNGWDPIGSNGAYYGTAFSGVFDGNGHKIIGMNIDITTKPSGTRYLYVGLFANNSGTIKNLSLTDGVVSAEISPYSGYVAYTGSICGYNSGTISNCYNNCPVSGYFDYTGGICGYSNTATIELCKNEGNVSSYCEYIGGICGYAQGGKILRCTNSGNAITTYTYTSYDVYIGGILGCSYNGTTISECYNTGNIYSDRKSVV